MIEHGYFPGIVGDVTAMHGRYYGNEWKFGLEFESMVARGLSDFFETYDPALDVALSVREDGVTRGFIAINGNRLELFEAKLRWFILDDGLRGRGLGRKLMDEAVAFSKTAGFRRVELFTFEGLDQARKLYTEYGFTVAEKKKWTEWGPEVAYERYELLLGAPPKPVEHAQT